MYREVTSEGGVDDEEHPQRTGRAEHGSSPGTGQCAAGVGGHLVPPGGDGQCALRPGSGGSAELLDGGVGFGHGHDRSFARLAPMASRVVIIGRSVWPPSSEIGRASCRERVCPGRVDLGGRRIIKKKKKQQK